LTSWCFKERLGEYVEQAFTELEASVRDAHAP